MSQSTILSMLHGRASLRPNDVAFTFTDYEKDYAGVPESLTWSQLSRQNAECGARNPRARVGRRSGSHPGAAGPRLHPGIPGSHAGGAHRGSASAAPPRLELRPGRRGLCRYRALGCPHDVRGGGRRRRLRRSVTHGHRAEDRRDRCVEPGCRGRAEPSHSRFAEHRVSAVQLGFDPTAHRRDDVAPQRHGEFRAAHAPAFSRTPKSRRIPRLCRGCPSTTTWVWCWASAHRSWAAITRS